MELSETFQAVRPALVAFMPKYLPLRGPGARRPELFPIMGTGFAIADGLVVTNAHVIDELERLPKPKEAPQDEWPFVVVLFHFVDKAAAPNSPTEGIAEIPLEVLRVFKIGELQFSTTGYYYGPRRPDFSVVHVKAKELPTVKLLPDTSLLKVGTEIATLGYPMGTDALTAPGWLHQIGPTLQRGIISAVLPFPCERPHSFVINIMSQGGASGSPVFLTDDARALGVLNAGLEERTKSFIVNHRGDVENRDYVNVPTNLSYVVPAYFLSSFLETIREDQRFQLPADTKTLHEILQTSSFVIPKERGEHSEPPQPGVINISDADPNLGGVVKITEVKRD